MLYFEILGFTLGFLMAASALVLWLCPKAYSDFALQRVCPEKKPAWLDLLGAATVAWVIFSWFRFFEAPHIYSFVISLVLSTSLIKIGLVLFNYRLFRHLIEALLLHEKAARSILAACMLLIGSGLVVVSALIATIAG